MPTEFASRQTTVRRFLDEFRPWICSKLGCGMEETVLLELDFPVAQVAATHVLIGVRLRSDHSRPIRELRQLVETIELPSDSYPSFEVHLAREPRGRFANPKTSTRGRVAGRSRGSLAARSSRTGRDRQHPDLAGRPWCGTNMRLRNSPEEVCAGFPQSHRENQRADAIQLMCMCLAAAISESVGLPGMTWCCVGRS